MGGKKHHQQRQHKRAEFTGSRCFFHATLQNHIPNRMEMPFSVEFWHSSEYQGYGKIAKRPANSCKSLFEYNQISIIQFEYGGTWKFKDQVYNIHDIFDFLSTYGFTFYDTQQELKQVNKDTFPNDYKGTNLLSIHNSVMFLD